MNKYMKICEACKGTHFVGDLECGECDGKGWIPNEDGEELLDFLKRMGVGED